MPNDVLPETEQPARASVLERVSWAGLGLSLLGSLMLRGVGLDHLPGINGDEAQYTVHALAWLDGAPVSSLRTGTGLPMNPPFFGLVVLLQALLEPSLLTLRLSALIHSLLAIGLAFALFRRRGLGFAAVFASMVASLPIHVGYARFAWDTAAIPTMLVLAIAAATRLKPYWTALAFVMCLWVHPASVFSLPLIAAPYAARAWPRTAAGDLRAPSSRALAVGAMTFMAVALACLALVYYQLLPDRVLAVFHGQFIARALERAMSPTDALRFLGLYVELLCGPTIYRYITGSLAPAAVWTHVLSFIGCVAPLSFFALRRLWRLRRWEELALWPGLVASLAVAYVVGGMKVLTPATERYGLFFTVPSCYLLAVCVQALSTDARRAAWLRCGVAIAGLALSLSFAVNYLAALHHPDPRRENAFRTGDEDPKLLAFRAVLRARDPQRTTLVLAQDWWIYWAMRYLAHREPNLRITIYGQRWDPRFPPDFQTPGLGADADVFAIAWAGSAFEDLVREYALARIAISGYEPRPILQVIHLRPPARR